MRDALEMCAGYLSVWRNIHRLNTAKNELRPPGNLIQVRLCDLRVFTLEIT